MTKRDFIALADAMRGVLAENSAWQTDDKRFKYEVRRRLIAFCASQNPRFMIQRWCDYLDRKRGPNGGKRKG